MDPEPLACWLSLTAPTGGRVPAGLAGMDLGDLPPGGDVDLDALAVELERYEAQVRADAADAAAAAAPAAPTPTRPEPTPVAPTAVGSSVEELEHECFVLEIPGSCNALIDLLEATSGAPDLGAFDAFEPVDPLVACGIGSNGSFLTEEQERCLGMDPITVVEDDADYTIEWDLEAAQAIWDEAQARAKARIREVCGSRGGYTFDDYFENEDFWIECYQ